MIDGDTVPTARASGNGDGDGDGAIVEEHVTFTFAALCRASGAGSDEVHALVVEGLLHPVGEGPDDWRFAGPSLPRARQALRLAHDLQLSLMGAAIVMDLLAEIATLKSLLQRR